MRSNSRPTNDPKRKSEAYLVRMFGTAADYLNSLTHKNNQHTVFTMRSVAAGRANSRGARKRSTGSQTQGNEY
jgi:hypothetical protein